MPIVVGYIPSPAGKAALTSAIDEARRRDVRLVVLNASRGDALVDRRHSSADDWDDVQQELERSGVEFEVSRQVEAKDPGEQVLEIARQTNAELIVIGLRRRTPVGKLIMGSQAQTILLHADCPVLAVKAETG
jgi:nucleotide-binding universal stress UspA family protein